MNDTLAITYSTPARLSEAEKLARQMKLPLVSLNSTDYSFLLVFTPAHLELRSTGTKAPGPLYVDFLKGATAHRRLFGGGRSQLIVRAVGLKSHPHPTILDLTAGLGRDAFVLANLGCDVLMIERNPVIALLLRDGLERAQSVEWSKSLKLELIEIDAQIYLSTLKKQFDVIYMDPMYPIRKKSALVKKEMRILRRLVGADDDAPQLLALALKKAKHRVVIKRPRLSNPLPGPAPDVVYEGKSSRFDVYLLKPSS
ncbi:SAM-dependent methyltransferase [Coxiella burnetii]|uniref:class I SAM-dependent methyltransferase n=2 Tax=Coxiella burnetii TaxID=777 RepID=UPI00037244BD|nr:class I SAM-dependent methyltransferase [Coxiella burnetii]AML48231.1 SAM-dependent methyltransferase [Coxiella burnetii]AML54246.1 SAM-dependent methyltransferase [Coxiella burnetii]ATN68210.1 SAM-dependent methyltransferase [Coxiella burnetii]ATN70137.1 SAM-dependent methyltransferase [Coxiella burnetii]ATN72083.1 SAM-dependent methyltransferase [Coxiella burnetii]